MVPLSFLDAAMAAFSADLAAERERYAELLDRYGSLKMAGAVEVLPHDSRAEKSSPGP